MGNKSKRPEGNLSYWEYISKGIGVKIIGVVLVCFGLIYLAGFLYPEVSSLIELKYLAVIIGAPMALFFIGNYVAWRKL